MFVCVLCARAVCVGQARERATPDDIGPITVQKRIVR